MCLTMCLISMSFLEVLGYVCVCVCACALGEFGCVCACGNVYGWVWSVCAREVVGVSRCVY